MSDDAMDRAVEAAARARSDQWAAEMRTGWAWDDLRPEDQQACRELVRPLVEAAAPILRAEALDGVVTELPCPDCAEHVARRADQWHADAADVHSVAAAQGAL